MEMMILTALFLSFGMFCLGIQAGIMQAHRSIPVKDGDRHPDDQSPSWLFVGLIALCIAGICAILAYNPAEKLKANADKVRSQYATEEALTK